MTGIAKVAGAAQMPNLTEKTKETSNGGAFGDMMNAIQDVKAQGAYYEKVSSGQASGDDDWVVALANLQTDLQVIKRLGDELMAIAKEVSHFQV